MCDISLMASKPDIEAIRDSILRAMEKKGFSRRSLSLKAGLSQTSVRDLLERTDNPGIGTLHKIAEALDLPPEAINGASAVPLLGQIGAGGLVAYFKEDAEIETVPRPPLASGPLMALTVSGSSMLPKYEPGDIIYVRRDHDGVLAAYMNRYCAVHLIDGGTYLKMLSPGTQPGLYTLRSLNAADMIDVEVVWASPVLFVMPAWTFQEASNDKNIA
jgi:lambda repressor-like predicted transcriptional regulator